MDHVRTMEDKDIDKCIIQIAEGDITSLKRLYDEFRIPVYKFALSILKSHEAAEDVSQETFVRIQIGAPKFQARGNSRAWIFSIVRNLAISQLRQNQRRENYREGAAAFDPFQESRCEQEEAFKILDLLNRDERVIVILRILAELSHKEIAQTLRLPCAAVRWKYAYAIKKLNRFLTLQSKEESMSYEAGRLEDQRVSSEQL